MQHHVRHLGTLLVLSLMSAAFHAAAQSPAAPVNPAAAMVPGPYGAPVSLADAKKATAAAFAEAQKFNVPLVIAVTDIAGELIYIERMDGAISGGVHVAQQKATTAAIYKRPTKVFEDAVAQGGIGLRFLRLDRVVPIEGGHPIVQNGRLVGAIGVSGGTGVQDGIAARAGADAIK